MSAGTEQRKLAAIMFTDMVGYSALAQRNEALALELLEEHRSLLRSLFPRFNGREVKTIGDAFLVEFHSALEAAQCAIEIQRTLAKRNHDVPAAKRIEVRIGIHIGDVVQRADGDVLGDGVNIASRIEPLAGANGICISVDVERQIRNTIEASLVKLGATELKNIQVPMELFRIVLPWEQTQVGHPSKPEAGANRRLRVVAVSTILLVAVGTAIFLPGLLKRSRTPGQPTPTPAPAQPAPARTMAVLPLTSVGADQASQELAKGMTEELVSKLGTISALRVIDGTKSSIAGSDAERFWREKGVGSLLEGNVQQDAGRVRIRLKLLDSQSAEVRWTRQFDRDLKHIIEMQGEVALAVALALQVQLAPNEQAALQLAPTSNPEAYKQYLKGRFHLTRGTKEGFEQSLVSFKEAIRLDGRFAKAYSGIADAYMLAMGWFVEDAVALSLGMEAATNAVALDATAPEAHASLGSFYTASWRWAEAESAFKIALRLNPRYAQGHMGYGWLSVLTGNGETGLNQLLHAHELEPGDPMFATGAGWACVHLGRWDTATNYLSKALELDRNLWFAQEKLGLSFAFQGSYAQAIVWSEKAVQGSQRNVEALGTLGWVYGKAGNSAKAQVILNELLTTKQPRTTPPWNLAFVYVGLNQNEEAIKQLQEGIRIRDPGMMFIGFDRRFDPLRQDARFTEIMKTIGLTK